MRPISVHAYSMGLNYSASDPVVPPQWDLILAEYGMSESDFLSHLRNRTNGSTGKKIESIKKWVFSKYRSHFVPEKVLLELGIQLGNTYDDPDLMYSILDGIKGGD